jgi:phage terminase small subunit
MKNGNASKPPKAQRRELEPLEPVDAKDGPAMLALPTDRHRAFVRALYTVRPGHGARVKAATLAGFGTPQSSPQSMATISSRLSHDERVLAAIAEEDKKHIRAVAPRAIHALERLIETPGHRDHMRAVATALERTNPVETVLQVKHSVTPEFKDTAQVLARIAELAAKFCVRLPAPVIIEAKANEASHAEN